MRYGIKLYFSDRRQELSQPLLFADSDTDAASSFVTFFFYGSLSCVSFAKSSKLLNLGRNDLKDQIEINCAGMN